MEYGLLHEVTEGLKGRRGDWKTIAEEVEGVSFSMIDKLGRGKYASSPTVGKLERIATWLRDHPAEQAVA